MMIKSIRFGFATNSSSSHSVVLSDKMVRDPYEALKNYTNSGEDEFGWNVETFSHPDSIINYAFLLFSGNTTLISDLIAAAKLKGENINYSPELWKEVVEASELPDWLKAWLLLKTPSGWHGLGYIDHQSNYWPQELSGMKNEEAFLQFIGTCLSITTGNDND
jgi:hypothetical protein